MVNYYKILEVENYASEEVVRKAYIQKIRQFHPDINDSPSAYKVAQVLNQAKDILTNPSTKATYDKELKLAYLIEITKLKNAPASRNFIFERRKQREEMMKIRDKEAYEAGKRKFPLKFRTAGLILFALWGLQILYSNYFFMHNGIEPVYCFLGVFMMVSCCAIATNEIYKYYYHKSISQAVRFNFELVCMWFLIISIPLVFVLSIGGIELAKNYMLKNNYSYYYASVEAVGNYNTLVYSYTINGKTYVKDVDELDIPVSEVLNAIKEGRILIKYANPNPKITQYVYVEQTESTPL